MSEQGELKNKIWAQMPLITLKILDKEGNSEELKAEFETINTILDEAHKELTDGLTTIVKNSELLTTENEQEKTLKAMILLDTIQKFYASWVKKQFGKNSLTEPTH